MKEHMFKGAVVATAVSMAAACGGGSTERSTEEILADYGEQSQKIVDSAIAGFNTDMENQSAHAEYNEGNCVYFEAADEPTDVIIKDPIMNTLYGEDDSFTNFFVYPSLNDEGEFVAKAGPVEFYSEGFDEEISDEPGDMYADAPFQWLENPDYSWEVTEVGEIQTNGISAWFVGPNGERISETRELALDYEGQVKPEIDIIAEELCGKPLGMSQEDDTESENQDPSVQDQLDELGGTEI